MTNTSAQDSPIQLAPQPAAPYGSVVIMLHSHLPYYRKHGMWPFGEENLYECMAETYIPLLDAVNELLDEGIKAKLTIGLTPILVEQLADPDLHEGFLEFLNQRITAAKNDIERFSTDKTIEHHEHLLFLANWYHQFYLLSKNRFENRYQRNLVQAFKLLQDAGAIEITTSGATHGFSPLLGKDESVNAQFKVGVESYKHHFGRAPKGCWLPECAYRPEEKESALGSYYASTFKRPSTDAFLHENDLKYFFTEYHAIEGGVPSSLRRVFGVYGNIEYIPLPPRPATGLSTFEAYWMKTYPVAVMGRNNRASFQVWSAAHGYPGDGQYREFHKKDEVSGLHYWRLTSKDTDLGDKMLYDPVQAFQQTHSQAAHFSGLVNDLLAEQAHQKEPGLLMISFDTELYGHWWFEGVTWLKHLVRAIHQNQNVALQTGSEYLETQPPKNAIELPESSWGQGGHYWVWQNHMTEWMWPIIHRAENKMKEVIEQYPNEENPLKKRLLNQLLRELLLLEGSDWPFLVTTFQAKDYAIERFEQHVQRFWTLADMLNSGQVDEHHLGELEHIDNPFPILDYRWFNYQRKVVQQDQTLEKATATV